VPNIDSTSIDCICATDPHCQSPVAPGIWFTPYIAPGMFEGCFVVDTLLRSTLECFYSDSCLSVYYYLINLTLNIIDTDIEWFNVHPLIYDEMSTRFALNTPLLVIVKEMMVEQWNPSLSFDRYYEDCAPKYCMYTQTVDTYSLIDVIIKLVSIIGGLTVALRLLTPGLVKIVIHMLKPKVKRQPKGNH
jgi:hypothetical protein